MANGANVSLLETLKAISVSCRGIRHAPGCHVGFLPHPTRKNECVRLALVDEHRFVFSYWLQWRHESLDKLRRRGGDRAESELRAPTLITVDWHNDVGVNGDCDPEELCNLDCGNEALLALYSWICLPGNNDGHIIPAAYLNAIGDVYVLLKQLGNRPETHNREFNDRAGNPHQIKHYSSVEALICDLEDADPRNVILDLDLDYFSRWENDDFASIQIVPDSEIQALMMVHAPLMHFILPRITGMTVALEPKYCGGIRNSFHILSVIDALLFSPSFLHKNCAWSKNVVNESQGDIP